MWKMWRTTEDLREQHNVEGDVEDHRVQHNVEGDVEDLRVQHNVEDVENH